MLNPILNLFFSKNVQHISFVVYLIPLQVELSDWSLSLLFDAKTIGFFLFWSHRAHKLPIDDVFHPFCRYIMLEYELDGVGGIFYSAADAIC